MATKMRRENKGSSFDDCLRKEGIYEEVSAADHQAGFCPVDRKRHEGKTAIHGGGGAADAHQSRGSGLLA
jgi:hypothetical protein